MAGGGAARLADRALAAVDRLSAGLAAVACAALALIFVLLLAEIVVRAVLHATISISWEFGSYLMATTVFLGAAYTLRTGGHVRVGLFFELLGPRRSRWLDLVATLAGLVVVSLVALAMAQLAQLSYERNVRSWYPTQTPLFIPQAAVALGAWALVLQLLARAAALLLGRPPETPHSSETGVQGEG